MIFNFRGSPFQAAFVLALGTLVVGHFTLAEAQAQQGAQDTGRGGRGGRGGAGGGRAGFGAAAAVPYDDYTGYVSLWDGKTLNNWDGESDVWSIDHGFIHADTTKTPGQHHLIYVGPNNVMRDFILKVEFKISGPPEGGGRGGANGGIQYRSRLLNRGGSIANPMGNPLPPGITNMQEAIDAGVAQVPPPPPEGAAANGRGGRGGARSAPNLWQVSGYQFDLNTGNNYTGQLYEGQGRSIIVNNGIALLPPDGSKIKIGDIGDDNTKFIHPHMGLDGEWQQVEIIASGNTMIHMINGHVISVVVDNDPGQRAYQGIMSLQLEGSGQVWYRNVYVKTLTPPLDFPEAEN